MIHGQNTLLQTETFVLAIPITADRLNLQVSIVSLVDTRMKKNLEVFIICFLVIRQKWIWKFPLSVVGKSGWKGICVSIVTSRGVRVKLETKIRSAICSTKHHRTRLNGFEHWSGSLLSLFKSCQRFNRIFISGPAEIMLYYCLITRAADLKLKKVLVSGGSSYTNLVLLITLLKLSL